MSEKTPLQLILQSAAVAELKRELALLPHSVSIDLLLTLALVNVYAAGQLDGLTKGEAIAQRSLLDLAGLLAGDAKRITPATPLAQNETIRPAIADKTPE